jgi:hypothetical protein
MDDDVIMNIAQNIKVKTALLALGIMSTSSAFANTTYTYSDANFSGLFNGSFTVAAKLADQTYHFFQCTLNNTFTYGGNTFNNYNGSTAGSGLPAITSSTGFIDTVVSAQTTGYANQAYAYATPLDPVFSLTILNGQVSAWDMSYTTKGTYITRPANYNVYHTASVQNTTTNNFDSVVMLATTNNVLGGVGPVSSAGIWSIYSTVAAVPEPETYAMLLAGLGLIGTMARRKHK